MCEENTHENQHINQKLLDMLEAQGKWNEDDDTTSDINIENN